MNRRTIILISALILVIAAFFILRRNNSNTLSVEGRDFNFKSTAAIDKIFISNKRTGEYVILEKESEGKWLLNKKHAASIYQIDILLETMRKISVKKPVSNKEKEEVKRNLVLNSTKVEIYEKGNLSKVFYVGGNTADEMGTYFYMENAKEPFVCHIAGFNGYLNSRFFTEENGWRSKSVFAYKENEIRKISVNWTEEQVSSFIVLNDKGKVILINGSNSQVDEKAINQNKLKSYLNLWENLSFEGFPINLDSTKIDSIARSKPFMIISLEDKNKKITTLSIHRKPIYTDSDMQYDKQGNPLQFEIENFYAFINGSKTEVVQIQDYVFGKVMKKQQDFMLSKQNQ